MSETQLSPATHRIRVLFRALLIAAASLTASTLPFWPAIQGGWVYDDLLLVAEDSRLQSWRGVVELWSSDLFSARRFLLQLGGHRPFYRPVVATSYALDWWWGKGSPTAFHITNLVVHFAAVLLGFRTLLRWGTSRPVALTASLLFALHPTRVESVAWISGRTDVMSAAFLLGASTLYAHARRPPPVPGVRWTFWGATYLCAVLALLSKETAVVFPLFALIEEWRRHERPLADFFLDFRSWWRPLSGIIALVALYLLGRGLFLPLGSPSSAVAPLSLHHLQLIAESAARHAEYVFFPKDLTLHRSRLAFDSQGKLLLSPTYIAIGTGVLFTYVALLFRAWSRPRLWWLLLLAGALLLPVSNLVPTGLSFSAQARYTYFALLPLSAAILSIVEGWLPRFWKATPLLALLALGTWARSADFQSNSSFWEAEFRANPGVPETIQEKLGRSLPLVGRANYLRRAICGYERSMRHYGSGPAAPFVKLAVKALVDDPSLSEDRQSQLLDFIEALTDERPAELEDRLRISLLPDSSVARTLRRSAPQLHLMAAQLHLRRGDIESALNRAAQMLEACPHCEDLRLQAALVPLVAGRPELLRDWVAPLRIAERRQVERAFSLLHQKTARTEAQRAWSAAEAGRLLQLPAFPYQAVHPHLEAIAAEAPIHVRMAVALMARNVGDLAMAQAMFNTLPQEQRLQWTADGLWPAPVLDRDEPFVEGTCALPSELEKR